MVDIIRDNKTVEPTSNSAWSSATSQSCSTATAKDIMLLKEPFMKIISSVDA
jgi:hypothetical protein